MAEATVAKKISRPVSAAQKSRSQKPARTKQMLVVLFLFVCCAASFYFFREVMSMSGTDNFDLDPAAPAEPSPEARAEKEEIVKTTEDLSGMMESDRLVMQTALLAEAASKYPVAAATVLSPQAPEPVPAPDPNPLPVEEPTPPQVTVLGVLSTEGENVAMIDVLGEDSGLIIRNGSMFADGTARVTKIDSKGVTFVWRKKSYQVGIEQ
jgi:hypothetical protein